jgi:hypothetical protein
MAPQHLRETFNRRLVTSPTTALMEDRRARVGGETTAQTEIDSAVALLKSEIITRGCQRTSTEIGKEEIDTDRLIIEGAN